MEFAKIRDVKSPQRGTMGSAGIDFFIPEANERFLNDFAKENPEILTVLNKEGKVEFILKPQSDVLIPSGIKVHIPMNKVLIAFNKSGIARKHKKVIGSQVIDSDYQGEILIHVYNYSNKPTKFTEGQKITQFLLIDAWHGQPKEVKIENLYKMESERGDGGFSSTGLH